MKKIFSIILIICIVIAICMPFAVSVFASEVHKENEIIESISSIIEDVYYKKDIGGELTTKAFGFSNDITVFLSNKISTHQYVLNLYDIEKENYNVDVILLNSEKKDSFMKFEFQVITTFNYVGVDVDTTVSEIINILYDSSLNEIVDFYNPLNYYDTAIRNDDFLSDSQITSFEKYILSSDIKTKQKSLISDIDDTFELESTVENTAKTSISTVQPRTSTLDNTAVVGWARANYAKDTPSSGNASIVKSYYDFSEISGSFDCTNFVSHALLAGGANINDSGNSGISGSGWYFRNLSNRSSSWSGVNQLYNYMSTSTTPNKATAKNAISQYSQNGSTWGEGCVIQFNYGGDSSYDHSCIITEKYRPSNDNHCYALVTGRTGDGRYNNNVSPTEIEPNYPKRTMRVYNY